MEQSTADFKALIGRSGNIVLVGHFNPDGDSVGSVTAMYHALEENFSKKATVVLPSSFPGFLSFLDIKGNPILVHPRDHRKIREAFAAADLLVCLDFNRISRTEEIAPLISACNAPKVLIDHHLNPQRDSFDIVFSSTEVSSACEVLYGVLQDMECKLSLATATSLYTGMMTDTNNYANSVHPSTLRMASNLLEAGVDKDRIQQQVLCSHTEERMRLMGYVLYEKMKVLEDRHAAYFILTDEEKKRFGFRQGDSEGFVNLPLNIAGVSISAFFSEQEEGYIKVSLRSKGEISVNDLSNRFFNGGGHRNAAGGRLNMPVGEVADYFERSLNEFLGIKPADER